MEIKLRKFTKSKTYQKYAKNTKVHSIEPLANVIESTLKDSKIQLYRTYGNFFWNPDMKKIYKNPEASQLVCSVITEFLAEEFDALTIEKANEIATHYISLSNNPSNFKKHAIVCPLLVRAKKNAISMFRRAFNETNKETGMMSEHYTPDDNEIAMLCDADYEGHTLTITFENERNEVCLPDHTTNK